MHPAPIPAVDAAARQHLAFLAERGFTSDPVVSQKEVQRAGFQSMWYRGERWGIEVYLEYREGYYDVRLVPLEGGQPRQVPFGFRTKWRLEDYLRRILRVRDRDIGLIDQVYEAAGPFTERLTVEFADRIFSLYGALLARHLDAIIASPHPPVGRK